MSETLDNHGTMSYTEDNNDKNVVVKMDEQRPINDIECKHKVLIPDPTDTIGDAIFHGCGNRLCGMGWYIQPK